MQKQNLIIESHLNIDDVDLGQNTSKNAVEYLAAATTLSKQQIKQAMQKGAVWLQQGDHLQRLRRAKKALSEGSQLHLYYNQSILSQQIATPIQVADEGAYSIWFKPYGVYCQGSKWGDHCTIARAIELQQDRPAFIVHRLDRATSGLIIIAHKKSLLSDFTKIFQERRITKKYRAIVGGNFPSNNEVITSNTPIDDRSARSHFRKLHHDSAVNQSVLEVTIETGRKHQIRKHLSELGHPIIGDRLYGNESEFTCDLQLYACFLSFKSPLDGTLKTYQLAPSFMPLLAY